MIGDNTRYVEMYGSRYENRQGIEEHGNDNYSQEIKPF